VPSGAFAGIARLSPPQIHSPGIRPKLARGLLNLGYKLGYKKVSKISQGGDGTTLKPKNQGMSDEPE
jgi:hypothetical protein